MKSSVYLRPVRLSDAPVVFQAIESSRKNLRRWLPWVDGVRAVKDEAAFIRKGVAAKRKGLAHIFCIFHQSTGRFLGVIDLRDIGQWMRRPLIGYWVRADEQGRGYATEACRQVVDFAFAKLKLPVIEILVQPENTSSARIPKKLGFKLEGTLRRNAVVNGRRIDHLSFSLLKSEWVRARNRV